MGSKLVLGSVSVKLFAPASAIIYSFKICERNVLSLAQGAESLLIPRVYSWWFWISEPYLLAFKGIGVYPSKCIWRKQCSICHLFSSTLIEMALGSLLTMETFLSIYTPPPPILKNNNDTECMQYSSGTDLWILLCFICIFITWCNRAWAVLDKMLQSELSYFLTSP